MSTITSHMPPITVQRPTKTNELTTSQEILEACRESFTKFTDPPLTMIGRYFNSKWASAVVDQNKQQVTFSLPRGVSKATLDRVRAILANIVSDYTIAFNTHSKAQLVSFKNRELGARQKPYNNTYDIDEQLSQFTLNPRVINLHNPKLAQVIEPSLNIDETSKNN